MTTTNNQKFHFEEDFTEDDIRCIPMCVRFKLDAAGIKLKLAEWSRFLPRERNRLMLQTCSTMEQVNEYRNYLCRLIVMRSGNKPTELDKEKSPAWAHISVIDPELNEKASEYNWQISLEQWRALSDLQRFALLKLYRPGHESNNFPKAMMEFGLANSYVEC